MANTPVIELSHISRHFGSGNAAVTVLKDISLRVHAGEMVAIIGASGSGKYGGVIILILIVHTSSKPTAFDSRGIGRNTGFDTRREKMI